jgi:hypothetical protein
MVPPTGRDKEGSNSETAGTERMESTPMIVSAAPGDPTAIPVSGDLPPDFLDRIVSGRSVTFTLPDGTLATGGVQLIDRDANGVLFVQGRLTAPHPGFYFFQRQTVTGLAGPMVGNVRFDGKNEAWRSEPNAGLTTARMVA